MKLSDKVWSFIFLLVNAFLLVFNQDIVFGICTTALLSATMIIIKPPTDYKSPPSLLIIITDIMAWFGKAFLVCLSFTIVVHYLGGATTAIHVFTRLLLVATSIMYWVRCDS
jgi:hypothetical protein